MWNLKKKNTKEQMKQKQKETTLIEKKNQWIPMGREKGGGAREHEGIKRENCYIENK